MLLTRHANDPLPLHTHLLLLQLLTYIHTRVTYSEEVMLHRWYYFVVGFLSVAAPFKSAPIPLHEFPSQYYPLLRVFQCLLFSLNCQNGRPMAKQNSRFWSFLITCIFFIAMFVTIIYRAYIYIYLLIMFYLYELLVLFHQEKSQTKTSITQLHYSYIYKSIADETRVSWQLCYSLLASLVLYFKKRVKKKSII